MVTNDVLAANQDALSAQIGEVRTMVQGFANTYTRTDIFELRLKEIDTSIAGINVSVQTLALEIKKASNRSRLQTWVTGTLSASAGVVLALLVEFYLANVGKK